MSVTVRTARPTDWRAFVHADERAFGVAYAESDLALAREALDLGDVLLAEADGQLAGVCNHFRLGVTVPGGAQVPMPGVSWVSTVATHRRRGVLRALMTAQHHRFLDEGAVLSGLTASEATIYGRFGYGQATSRVQWEVDRRAGALRVDAPDPGGVVMVDHDEARAHGPGVYRRWAARTPGAVTRPASWWDFLLADQESARGGASQLFFLRHPDGFCSYRIRHGETTRVEVFDLVAASDEGLAALWRVLLGLDLSDVISFRGSPADPVRYLLADPRAARVTEDRDGLWLRVLDVPAALRARRYAAPVDVVLAVHDAFLDRGGVFRLAGGPDGAECTRVDTEPELSLTVADLGSLYLGAHRATDLHAAGRLVGTPASARAFDLALVSERTPRHGTDF